MQSLFYTLSKEMSSAVFSSAMKAYVSLDPPLKGGGSGETRILKGMQLSCGNYVFSVGVV